MKFGVKVSSQDDLRGRVTKLEIVLDQMGLRALRRIMRGAAYDMARAGASDDDREDGTVAKQILEVLK